MWTGAIAILSAACVAAVVPERERMTLRGAVTDEAGPVAGAVVTAWPAGTAAEAQASEPPPSSAPRSGVTGADGTFVLRGLDAGTWHVVRAVAEHHAVGLGGGRPSESHPEIRLARAGSLKVTLDADADGATIECFQGEDDDATETGRATFGGRTARLDGLPPGPADCQLANATSSGRIETTIVAGTTVEVEATLAEDVVMAVTVLDASSRDPIAGAEVANPIAGEVLTDAGGVARLRFPVRIQEVSREEIEDFLDVYANASAFRPEAIRLSWPLPAAATIALAPLPVLRGRVVDAAGSAAAGVRLTWDRHEELETTSAGDGRFALPRPAVRRPLRLLASRVAGETEDIAALEVAPDAIDVVVRLAPRPRRGVVVIARDASGPVAGAAVFVVDPGARVHVVGAPPAPSPTGRDGRCVVERLDGDMAHVLVLAPGGRGALRTHVALAPARLTELELVLEPGWRIQGRVQREGRPVEGAAVEAWHAKLPWALGSALSHADGTFVLDGMPAGDEEITLHATTRDGLRGDAVVSRARPSATIELGESAGGRDEGP